MSLVRICSRRRGDFGQIGRFAELFGEFGAVGEPDQPVVHGMDREPAGGLGRARKRTLPMAATLSSLRMLVPALYGEQRCHENSRIGVAEGVDIAVAQDRCVSFVVAPDDDLDVVGLAHARRCPRAG